MDYAQPFGAAANAPYVNGDPSIGEAGSIPPAAALEAPQREMLAVIVAAGLTPSGSDLTQLLQAIRALAGGIIRVNDTGSANVLAGNGSPLISAYAGGQIFQVTKANAGNSSTTPSLNVNGKGAKTIVRRDGSALAAGDLPASSSFLVLYDGTNMRLLGLASSEVSSTALTVIQANGKAPKQTIFTASGTWTPDPAALAADIECIGGGAGGAGAVGQDPYGFTGAGGGAGATARKRIATSGLAAQAVTVGAGGAGGDGTAGVGGVNGTDGGASSVGALCSAGGGFKPHDFGYYPQLIPAAIGGKGGVASGGDLNIPGGDGSGTLAAYVQADAYGGTGGASSLGGGGAGSGNPQTGSQPALSGYSPNAQGESYAPAQNGAPGRAYGSGGGGGAAGKTGSTSKGAAGAPGIVIITEHFA